MAGNYPSVGRDVPTLATGVEEAMTEVLALQDFLYYVIGIHPGGIDSHQLVLYGVLLYWMSGGQKPHGQIHKCQVAVALVISLPRYTINTNL